MHIAKIEIGIYFVISMYTQAFGVHVAFVLYDIVKNSNLHHQHVNQRI